MESGIFEDIDEENNYYAVGFKNIDLLLNQIKKEMFIEKNFTITEPVKIKMRRCLDCDSFTVDEENEFNCAVCGEERLSNRRINAFSFRRIDISSDDYLSKG